MSWTKRQLIEAALEEIGLASYAYDVQPEQLESAMRRMDAMVAGWTALGIQINYPIPSSPQDAQLDDDTGIPDVAAQAILLGLAVQIAPSYGKTVSPDTKAGAKQGYGQLLTFTAQPIPKQLPETLPKGQGNKSWHGRYDRPFIQPVDDNTLTSPETEAGFNNE